MNQQQPIKPWNFTLTFIILIASIYTIWTFVAPIAWAGIFAIALWPLYCHWRKWLWSNDMLASLSALLLLIIIITIPLTWIIVLLIQEIQELIVLLKTINESGMAIPSWVTNIPIIGDKISVVWNDTIAHPGQFKNAFDTIMSHQSDIVPHLKSITQATSSHLFNTTITLLVFFFMLKDGNVIGKTFTRLGQRVWQNRWQLHGPKLLSAIRGTVNGTVLSALLFGLIMGIAYAVAGISLFALLGLMTGLLSMIPFGAFAVIAVTAIYLLTQSSIITAIILFIFGSVVESAIERFIKPKLIGSGTELPFIFVFLGILGGLDMFGIIGLFLGPVIMAMFITLINEYR